MQVLAWSIGRLTNGGEKIQLSRPFEVDDCRQALIGFGGSDLYSDGSQPQDFAAGADPWPVEADGQGESLSRIDPADLRQRSRELAGGGPFAGTGESVRAVTRRRSPAGFCRIALPEIAFLWYPCALDANARSARMHGQLAVCQ